MSYQQLAIGEQSLKEGKRVGRTTITRIAEPREQFSSGVSDGKL